MTVIVEEINKLIENKRAFYLYREPLGKEIVLGLPYAPLVININDITDYNGFIVSPFYLENSENHLNDKITDSISLNDTEYIDRNKIKKDLPVFLLPYHRELRFFLNEESVISETSEKIQSYISSLCSDKSYPEISSLQFDDSDFHIADKSEYLDQCSKTIDNIRNGNIKKMILSRQIRNTLNTLDDGADIFFSLEKKYPRAFTFLIHIPGCMSWVGASPELLADYKEKTFTTVSLAGTKRPEENWSEKEYEEQKMVTDYITDIFNKNKCNNISKDLLQTVKAGAIEHLQTIVKAETETTLLSKIIRELSPTAALCGTPKDKAYELIKEIEKHSRLYYGGFLGRINLNNGSSDDNVNSLKLFVNLRSALLKENESYIYVGGGITKDSVPEKEWEETCIKSQTLLSVFK